jgi:hypothetical protein
MTVFEAAKTSSGARRDDTDLRVGSADSREVEGRFERLVIVPFGYEKYQEWVQGRC